jgi:hypothetical protein
MSDDRQIPLFGDMLESLGALGGSTESKAAFVPGHKGCESLHTAVKGQIVGLLAEDSLTALQVNLLAVLLNCPAATDKAV